MLSRIRDDDSGFTLVELLVAIVILGVITIPIADAVLGVLQHTDQSSARLAESHDAQISSAYWASDVASLGTRSTVDPLDPRLQQSVETNVAYNAGKFPCGRPGTPDAVVRFAGDDVVSGPGGATTTVVVVAYVVTTTGPPYELHRLRCVGGSSTPSTDIVLAHDLAARPTVRCDDGGPCDGSGASVPRKVELPMTMRDPKSRQSTYEVTLTGQRRQE